MQKTCYNCHRTFNISNDDIARYESVQNYANTIFWQNTVNMGETGKQVNYKIQEQRRAQAIGSSVSNPYVCPYCGSDQNKEPVALDWLATLAIISWMLGFAAAIIALLFTITGDEGAYIFWLIAIPSIVWPFIVDSIQRQKINNRIQQQEAQQEAREAARQASKQKKQQKNQQKEYQSMKFGDIEWYILDKQKDKKSIISKYIVDCQPYNETKKRLLGKITH